MHAVETTTPEAERLVEDARARRRGGPLVRERAVEAVAGGAFLVAAIALALAGGAAGFDAGVAAMLVAGYALAARVEFEVGTGQTAPTQIVFVPMLFLVPPAVVPLLVCLAFALARVMDAVDGKRSLARAPLALSQSWHAIGPALVLVLAGADDPTTTAWPILVGALAAQFVVDTVVSALVDRLGLGVSVRAQLRPALWVYLTDALLAPAGLALAIAAHDDPRYVLLGLPLCGLLALFASERRRRLDNALELSQAYQGTAMLLGDVVEADDDYTGAHSRHVVSLAVAVAERLGLDSAARRRVEFGAMLHDVGKIHVPKEIINKPGRLTAEEWTVIKRHTIDGQRMLDAVGGVLSDVGLVVRSSHENYDGSGYPDGLAGDQIPIEARICSCCDAFSAMTTDRSYRKAMSGEVALAELRANAGTQFDPRVVDALLSVVSS